MWRGGDGSGHLDAINHVTSPAASDGDAYHLVLERDDRVAEDVTPSKPAARCGRRLCTRPRCLGAVLLCQGAAILAIGTYLVVLASRPTWPSGSVVQDFMVSPGQGCPISVGQPLSFGDDGSVRKGGGLSLYRSASQIYFSETIASHATAALDANHLVSAFLADDGTAYVMLAVTAAVAAASTRPSNDRANMAPWVWVDMATLNPTTPDVVMPLTNTTFAVAGNGYVTMGWIVPGNDGDGGHTDALYLSPPMPYVDAPTTRPSAAPRVSGTRGRGGGGVAPTSAMLDRVAMAVLSPSLLAISFYTHPGTANASLVTRVGRFVGPSSGGVPYPTIIPTPSPNPLAWLHASASPVPAGPTPGATPSQPPAAAAGRVDGDIVAAPAIEWPTIKWSAATMYAGAHLSHAMAAFDDTTYLLTYPLDDGVTVTNGFPLSVRAAQVTSTSLPTATGFDGVEVVLGTVATLSDVKAHYLFDTVTISPTQAVAVFVDEALSDGIRAVIINLRPGLGISFGTTLAINTGNAGGVSLAGSWLHLSVKALGQQVDDGDLASRAAAMASRLAMQQPLVAPHQPHMRSTHHVAAVVRPRANGGGRRLSGGDHYYDDDTDDGYLDDDDSHTVVGADREGRQFAVIYSDMANYGRVTLVVGCVTPSSDMILTSPAFVMSPNYYPAPITASTRQEGPAAHRHPASDESSGYYWISAAVLSPTQVVVMDTLDTTAAARMAWSWHAPPVPGHGDGGPPAHQGVEHHATINPGGRWSRRRAKAVAGAHAAATGMALCEHGLSVSKPQEAKHGMDRPAIMACRPHQLKPVPVLTAMDGGVEPPAMPTYYAAAVANLSVLEVLHNPIGMALTEGGCGAPVKVMLQGVFTYSDGAPQNGVPVTRPSSQNRTTVTTTWARVSEWLGAAAVEGALDPAGPFQPGKAYYADTLGRLIEGGYAGAGGLGAHGDNVAGGYITTVIPHKNTPTGATSVAYSNYVGVAISPNQLLIRPTP